jgi:hypothetical protein
VVLVQEHQKRLKCTTVKDVVTALGRVAGNVSECPNGLLANVEHGRRQKLNE